MRFTLFKHLNIAYISSAVTSLIVAWLSNALVELLWNSSHSSRWESGGNGHSWPFTSIFWSLGLFSLHNKFNSNFPLQFFEDELAGPSRRPRRKPVRFSDSPAYLTIGCECCICNNRCGLDSRYSWRSASAWVRSWLCSIRLCTKSFCDYHKQFI